MKRQTNKKLCKQLLSISLFLILTLTGLWAHPHPVSMGDVNADGQVNIIDALLIGQYAVGIVSQLPADAFTPVPPTITPPVPTPAITNSPTATPIIIPTSDPNQDFSNRGPYQTTYIRKTNHTIFTPRNLGQNGYKHPIIIWGNGTGATPSSYTGVLNHLASYGFVVIAANTTQAGSGDEMIQGIDIMIQENRNPSSSFYNKIDTSSIGASGHSQGGIGTIAAVVKDSRIICSAPLQGTYYSYGSFSTPVLAIAGSSDTIVSPTMVKRIYSTARGPAVYAELRGASHFAPVGSSPSSEILHYITAWFKLYLNDETQFTSMFFDRSSGINVDRSWSVEIKNY